MSAAPLNRRLPGGKRLVMVTGRGLSEVLAGRDALPRSRGKLTKAAVAATAVLGTTLLILMALVAVFCLIEVTSVSGSVSGLAGSGLFSAGGGLAGGAMFSAGGGLARSLGSASGPAGSVVRTSVSIGTRSWLPLMGLTPAMVSLSLYFPFLSWVGALLLCWRRPLTAWRAAVGALALTPLLPLPALTTLGQLLPLGMVFGVAGWRQSRAAMWWMAVITLAVLWGFPDGLTEPARAVASVELLAAATIIDVTGAWRRTRKALAAQEEQTELEEARRAVLEERSRIARELHDVVAHHMSLIAVQAETAPYRLSGLQPEALAELSSVSRQAREALAEMRKLLGVLRNDGPAERAPQPGLADIEELVRSCQRAGLPVQFAFSGASWGVPATTGQCAYRIVQESLANAATHSPGSLVVVNIAISEAAVQLWVGNGPASAPALAQGPARPGGHGLLGMRERVAMLGGSLRAGPAPDGGFQVAALLPLSAVEGQVLVRPAR